jgi:heat shock protein HtpX
VLVFGALVALLGYALTFFVADGNSVLVGAAIFTVISVLFSYYGGAAVVLVSTGAREIQKADDPELFTVVENLAITAGVPRPRIYIIPDAGLNAFATGRDPQHSHVAITNGLRQMLTRSELEAVMGHELSHVRNYDTLLMVLTALLFGMASLISSLLWRLGGWRGGRGRDRDGSPIFFLFAIVAAILAPIFANIIKFAISRQREYLADASSVMLTRYPEAMISALQKIAANPTVATGSEATAHLFIYSPLRQESWMNRLFSTHPPLADRIHALREGAHIHA